MEPYADAESEGDEDKRTDYGVYCVEKRKPLLVTAILLGIAAIVGVVVWLKMSNNGSPPDVPHRGIANCSKAFVHSCL